MTIKQRFTGHVYEFTIERGAVRLKLQFNGIDNQAIYEHAYKFGERQYRTDTKKNLMLRFAACFGAFRLMSDSYLIWKNFPAKIFELTRYGFRHEKKVKCSVWDS